MEVALGLLILVVLPACFMFLWLKNRAKAKRLTQETARLEDALNTAVAGQDKLNLDLACANENIEILQSQLDEKNNLLQRYQPVIDAEIEAANIIKNANDKSDAILNSAILNQKKSADILADAELKAQEIAGDAWAARDKLKEYEKQAQALKNIIDGYGDQYIIPPQSILDGLAEDYGFTEAGEQLKLARAHTRAMIKAGEGAACEYVEDYRRKTAEAFVLDAFNGKVDSALAKVRAENVGKLKQEIEDAFILVNKNGQAFRNARITKEYKESRLSELKWATAVMELRNIEREEQRAIKEKMREEEKARRDYERAMKEAAKDEAKLQAALEKVRMEMSQANEEQKTKYEQQLAELAVKLEEAEARSQRAQSMAQQTRSGYVYVISNIGSFGEEVFKIGMTRRLEPMDRVHELGDASVPFPFDVHAMMYCDDAPAIETAMHKKFNERRINKVNPRKEFFRLALKDIKNCADELGLEAQFTFLAEAKEFRDSLAISKLPKKELDEQMQRLLEEEKIGDEEENQ